MSAPSGLTQAAAAAAAASLTFVHVTNPSSETSAHVRRVVRSNATVHSHRDPSRKPKARKSSGYCVSLRGSGDLSENSEGNPGPEAKTTWSRRKQRTRRAEDRQSAPKSDETAGDEVDEEIPRPAAKPPTTAAALAAPVSSAPKLLYLDDVRRDPFDSSPIQLDSWHYWAVDYFRVTMAPEVSDIHIYGAAGAQQFSTWYLRHCMSEPSLFYSLLFGVTSQLEMRGRIDPRVSMFVRGRQLTALNEAIQDSDRAFSTPVVLTVCTLVFHELMYGDQSEAARMHLKAYTKMLGAIGGSEGLQAPAAFRKSHDRSYALIMAHYGNLGGGV